jgi:hypothetical protein
MIFSIILMPHQYSVNEVDLPYLRNKTLFISMKLTQSNFVCSLLLILLTLNACKHEPGAWRNDGIDESVRENFSELNKVLFEGLKANNPKLLEKILSKTMLEDVNRVRLIELCSIRMRKGKTVPLDEYYMVHDFNKESSIQSSNHGINSYSIKYLPTTREMYAAFYIVNDGAEEWLLSTIYNKLNYGWKLCELELNPYTINGKTAPELYQLAREQYAKGYLIDAVCTMNMFRNYAAPNVMWIYNRQSIMDEFYSKVIKEAEDTYSKTIVLNQVPTKPYVFRVFNQNVTEGSFPMVYYMSKINLQDTIAIKREFISVKEHIGNILPGIDKDKKYLFYTIFSEKSGAKKMYQDHINYTDKLK